MDANSVLGTGSDARERAHVAKEVFHIGPFGEGSRNTPGIEYESFLTDSRLTSIAKTGVRYVLDADSEYEQG